MKNQLKLNIHKNVWNVSSIITEDGPYISIIKNDTEVMRFAAEDLKEICENVLRFYEEYH